MEIVAAIGAALGAFGGVIDDLIFTDEERQALDVQRAAAQAQVEAARLAQKRAMLEVEAARLAQERAMLEAAAKARQAQAITVAAFTLGAALVIAALVWRKA